MPEVKPSGKGPDLIDMMLSKSSERVVDSETLIKETQNRVWRALKSGYEYSPQEDESDTFLRKQDRKSTRLNSSHSQQSRMPSSA